MRKEWVQIAGLLFLGMASLEASPTSAEIADSLDSPPEVVWSVVGPNGDAWGTDDDNDGEDDLELHTNVQEEVYTLSASVTGPGVLELEQELLNFTVTILVDGVQSGLPPSPGDHRSAVHVGAGSHTVVWRLLAAPAASTYGASASLSKALWGPYTPAPLQIAAGEGVILSGNWIGRADGSAWSGLGNSQRLKASFTGPGILSHRAWRRGEWWDFDFRMDGGIEEAISHPQGWRRDYRKVGAGAHTAEWRFYAGSGGVRSSEDMFVREVEMLPEVPLAEALDTPGRVWTASGGDAFGVEMEGTTGGSGVVMPSSASVSTFIPAEGIFRIRAAGYFYVLCNDASLPLNSLEENVNQSDGEWHDFAVKVPEGGGVLSIVASYDVIRIDSLVEVAIPASPEAVAGPGVSLVSGGTAPWEVVQDEELGSYAAQTLTSEEEPEAWMEAQVTGPAKATIRFDSFHGSRGAEILVDGKSCWDSTMSYSSGQEVKIEIPAGVHPIRFLVTGQAKLQKFEVIPLPEDSVSVALDDPGIWAYSGRWKRTTAMSHDGVDSLQPVSEAIENGGAPKLRRLINGPGTLAFQSGTIAPGYLESAYGGWIATSSLAYHTERYNDSSSGWKGESTWFPPGDHWFQWEARRYSSGGYAKIALDQVAFTADPVIPLAEALGGGLTWVNDSPVPWVGLSRGGNRPMAVCPLTEGGHTSLTTTVQGPGVLMFRWRDFGNAGTTFPLLVNGEPADIYPAFSSGDDDRMGITITQTGPVTIEWKAEASFKGYWMELEEVRWLSGDELLLGNALDAPAGMDWTTSGDALFLTAPNAAATGGTGAYVSLAPGQVSSLKTTVGGPGVFDFRLRRTMPPGRLDLPWSVLVDGREIAYQSTYEWDPLWITGPGPHEIELRFQNPAGASLEGSVMVDEVTWIPLLEQAPEPGLVISSVDGRTAFSGGVRSGAGGIILRNSWAYPSFVEKTVTGPCVVSWDSRGIRAGSNEQERELAVTVDGRGQVKLDSQHPWTRYALRIPAGQHVVRWTNLPLLEIPVSQGQPVPPDEVTPDAMWQIADLKVEAVSMPLADALDVEGALLLPGDDAGSVLHGATAKDGVDAWAAPAGYKFHYLNLTERDQLVTGWALLDDEGWACRKRIARAGQSILWQTPQSPTSVPYHESLLDQFRIDDFVEVSAAEALDAPEGVNFQGWKGRASAASSDGTDSIVSLMIEEDSAEYASLAVPTRSRVGFRWRREGYGQVSLYLDGVRLFAEPSEQWQEMVVEVPAGSSLQWSHQSTASGYPYSRGEAWIDHLVVESLPDLTLGEIAAPGTGIELENAVVVPSAYGNLQWKPVALQEQGIGVADGLRVAWGNHGLRASITGPVIINFEGRCFSSYLPIIQGGNAPRDTRSSVIIVNPPRPVIIGYGLAVSVGGRTAAVIKNTGSMEWKSGGVFIPAGTHEVTWLVSALYRALNGSEYYQPAGADTTTTTTIGTPPEQIQGWLRGISLQSTQAHYDGWAFALPEGKRDPEDDADGDGISNLIEYGFRTDASSAASRPALVTAGVNLTDAGYVGGDVIYPPTLDIRIPYVSPLAATFLESSNDLEHWTPTGDLLLSGQPVEGPSSYPTHSATHQLVRKPVNPIPSGGIPTFFRVRFALEGTPAGE